MTFTRFRVITVDRIIGRKRHGYMGQRKQAAGPGQLEIFVCSRSSAGRFGTRNHRVGIRVQVRHQRQCKRQLPFPQQTIRQHLRIGTQQRLGIRVPVDIKQHQLVIPRRQFHKQCIHQRGRFNRGINDRLEGYGPGEARHAIGTGESIHPCGNIARQLVNLVTGIDGKGTVFIGVKLGLYIGPAKLLKARQTRKTCLPDGVGGNTRDLDGGRQQHQPVNGRHILAFQHGQRIMHRQCGAVGVADKVQRAIRTKAITHTANSDPDCSNKVMPGDSRQTGRRRAMSWQTQSNHLELPLVQQLSDATQAIGRIRQTMQHDSTGKRLMLREYKGAVPVFRIAARITQAVG